MANKTRQNDDHLVELLSGYVDGALTQQQRQRVDVHCASCKVCENDLLELKALRESIGKARLSDSSQDKWGEMMDDATVQTSRGIGWLLLIGGILAAMGLGIYEFVLDSSLGLVERLIIGAIYGGLAIIFFSVLRQRWIERKTDKYKDVEI